MSTIATRDDQVELFAENKGVENQSGFTTGCQR